VIATSLGEIASGGDTELDAQVLQQDRHEVGKHHDKQQGVAKFRAAGQVGRPVARVHVPDGDQKTGSGEGEQLSPERRRYRDDDASMNFSEGNLPGRSAPCDFRTRRFGLMKLIHNLS